MPSVRKKMRQEKEGGEKAKSKSQDCCVTFKPKNLETLLSTRMPERRKLIFCIWIRRPQSVWPVNRLIGGEVLGLNSTTVTRKPLDYFQPPFSAKSPWANGLSQLMQLGHLKLAIGTTKIKQMLRAKYWFPIMNHLIGQTIKLFWLSSMSTKSHKQEPIEQAIGYSWRTVGTDLYWF